MTVRRSARRGMQMIFQDPYASLNPRWRVASVIAEPIVAQAPETPRAEVASRVAALLAQVGLASADGAKYPHQFAADRCRSEVPVLKAAPGGGAVACHAVEEDRI